MRSRPSLFAAALLMAGCAGTGIEKRLAEIDSKPYLADKIEVQDYEHVKLAPLTKVDGSQESLLRRHEQHKLDRETVRALDSAMAAKTQQVKSLRDALKSVEIGERAVLRANEYLKDAVEEERKASFWNTVKHSVIEVILGIALILK